MSASAYVDLSIRMTSGILKVPEYGGFIIDYYYRKSVSEVDDL